MSGPRVLHIDDGREFRGGQHQVELLMQGLAGRGITQWLAARPGAPLAGRAMRLGVPVFPISFKGELDPFAPAELASLARTHGANILHAHTAHAHSLALRAFRRIRRKDSGSRLVTTRRVDFKIKRGWFSRRKYTWPGQHFIAISHGVMDVLIEGGVDPARIDLVSSGVPPLPGERWDRERARREFGIGPGETAIATVGALTDHKGHRWLIEAAPAVLKRHPQACFHILGEGELRGELERRIAGLGLGGRFRLHGQVPEARGKLAGFDLYVSSSHLEGLGTAILDAMLAGLPVVAAATGGVPDAVKHGMTGWLAAPRDAASLAAEIVAALEIPRQQLDHVIQAARENVIVNFSADGMSRGVLGVYERLLAP